ncbi:hypothetical protein EYS42_12225 [Aquabacterium lacunae]|uniref:Type II secretion system protein n=1 Tax=Aquabacterium lacunae TaxID=2528630 RepID=A0A4Q9GZZ1_9BURK|nr:hypothetical protein [Aquabacterium lacunae]TBO30445.1 hypothetical protein EYS42_12225 [Aquabacterium lacunae]
MVALMSVSLVQVSNVWSAQAERQRAAHQQWVARQYVAAIERYALATPGRARELPKSVDDLLRDPRHGLNVVRHLRDAYAVDFSSQGGLELVWAPGGALVGVRRSADQLIWAVTPELVARP